MAKEVILNNLKRTLINNTFGGTWLSVFIAVFNYLNLWKIFS